MEIKERETIYNNIYQKVKKSNNINTNSLGVPTTKKGFDFYFSINKSRCNWSLGLKANYLKLSCEVPCGSHTTEESKKEGAKQRKSHPTIFYTTFGNEYISYTHTVRINNSTTEGDLWKATEDFIEFMKEASKFSETPGLAEENLQPEPQKNKEKIMEERQPQMLLKEEKKPSESKEKKAQKTDRKGKNAESNAKEKQNAAITNIAKDLTTDENQEQDASLEPNVTTVEENFDQKIQDLFEDIELAKEDSQKEHMSKIGNTEKTKSKTDSQTIELTQEEIDIRKNLTDEESSGIYNDLTLAFQSRKEHLDKKEELLNSQENSIRDTQQELDKKRRYLDEKEAGLNYKEKELDRRKRDMLQSEKDLVEKENSYAKRSNELIESERDLQIREKTLSEKESQLNVRENMNADKESQIKRKEIEIEKQEKMLAEKDNKLNELKKQMDLRANILKTQKTNIKYSMEELDIREQKISEQEKGTIPESLQEELDNIKSASAKKEEKIKIYQAKIEECKKTLLDFNERYKKVAAEVNTAINAKNQAIKERKKMEESYKKDIAELKNRLESNTEKDSNNTIADLQEENRILQEDLKSAHAETDSAKNEITSLKKEQRSLKMQLENYTNNSASANEDNTKLRELENVITEKENEISELKHKAENAKSKYESMLSENAPEELQKQLQEKDSKIVELNNRVIELESEQNHDRMVLSIKQQLQNNDIPCEIIPSEGPTVLTVQRDGCVIHINEQEKVIIAKKTVKNANKYKTQIIKFNNEDVHGFYYIEGKTIMVKRFLIDAVADVLSIAEKLRELN